MSMLVGFLRHYSPGSRSSPTPKGPRDCHSSSASTVIVCVCVCLCLSVYVCRCVCVAFVPLAAVTVDIPINIVHSNFMFEVDGQTHVARSAVHHNIHKDVFMREGLLLTMPLGVKYPDSGFVHCGNLMQPNAVCCN